MGKPNKQRKGDLPVIPKSKQKDKLVPALPIVPKVKPDDSDSERNDYHYQYWYPINIWWEEEDYIDEDRPY